MLKLRLREGETVIINGAVLRAAARTELALENRAAILRGRDVMKPEEAVTPASMLYFTTMLHYIDNTSRDRYQNSLLERLSDVVAVSKTLRGQSLCARFARLMAQREYYTALTVCRQLMAQEAALQQDREEAAA